MNSKLSLRLENYPEKSMASGEKTIAKNFYEYFVIHKV